MSLSLSLCTSRSRSPSPSLSPSLSPCVSACPCLGVACRFSTVTCAVVSAIRAVVYYITLLLKDADEEKRDVMSDHVFLAISIVCLARYELYCCLQTQKSNR